MLSYSASRASRRKSSTPTDAVVVVAEVAVAATEAAVAVPAEVERRIVDRDNPHVRELAERVVALSRTRMNSPAFELIASP